SAGRDQLLRLQHRGRLAPDHRADAHVSQGGGLVPRTPAPPSVRQRPAPGAARGRARRQGAQASPDRARELKVKARHALPATPEADARRVAAVPRGYSSWRLTSSRPNTKSAPNADAGVG